MPRGGGRSHGSRSHASHARSHGISHSHGIGSHSHGIGSHSTFGHHGIGSHSTFGHTSTFGHHTTSLHRKRATHSTFSSSSSGTHYGGGGGGGAVIFASSSGGGDCSGCNCFCFGLFLAVVALLGCLVAVWVAVPLSLAAGTRCTNATSLSRYQQATCRPTYSDAAADKEVVVKVSSRWDVGAYRFERQPPLRATLSSEYSFTENEFVEPEKWIALPVQLVHTSTVEYTVHVNLGDDCMFYVLTAANYELFAKGKLYDTEQTNWGLGFFGFFVAPADDLYYFVAHNYRSTRTALIDLDLDVRYARYDVSMAIEECEEEYECVFSYITGSTWIVTESTRSSAISLNMGLRLPSSKRIGIIVPLVVVPAIAFIAVMVIAICCCDRHSRKLLIQKAEMESAAAAANAPAPEVIVAAAPEVPTPGTSSDFPDGVPPQMVQPTASAPPAYLSAYPAPVAPPPAYSEPPLPPPSTIGSGDDLKLQAAISSYEPPPPSSQQPPGSMTMDYQPPLPPPSASEDPLPFSEPD